MLSDARVAEILKSTTRTVRLAECVTPLLEAFKEKVYTIG